MTAGKRTDAKWSVIVGVAGSGSIQPLVNFGNAKFTSCTATINGTVSHDLGHYNNTAIEMVNSGGVAFKAAGGAIDSAIESFTVAWESTGP